MMSKIQNLSLFKPNSGLRRIIANTGWLFADRIIRMGVGLIVGVWIARYLGVQQYGILNYATAFVALFSPLVTLGLDSVVVRHIVLDSYSKEQILGTAFWLKLFGGIVSLFLALAAIFLLRQDDKLTISLVAILAISGIFQAVDPIDFWFQSQVQSKYTVIAKNTAFFIITLLKVVLILRQAPLLAFAWAALAEIGLGAVGLLIVYKIRGYSVWLWSWSLQLAKTMFQESWPLILSGLTIMIYMRIDQIMLGQMVGDRAVGIYSSATRISEVWYFIPTAIYSSVSPAIFAAKKTNEDLYYQRIKQFLRLMVLLAVIVAVPMTFLSGTIITMLFGNGFAAAGKVLAIHIWTSVFVFMGLATQPWFIAEGLNQFLLRRTFIGAITNVFLNLLLIPTYTGVGAAIATVISQSVASFFANATHPKTQKIFLIQIKSLLPF